MKSLTWKVLLEFAAACGALGTAVGLLLLMYYCRSKGVPFPIGDVSALAVVAFAAAMFIGVVVLMLFLPSYYFPKKAITFRGCHACDDLSISLCRLKYFAYVPGFSILLVASIVFSLAYGDLPYVVVAIFLLIVYGVAVFVGAASLPSGGVSVGEVVHFSFLYAGWTLVCLGVYFPVVVSLGGTGLHYWLGVLLLVYVGAIQFVSYQRSILSTKAAASFLGLAVLGVVVYPISGAWLGGVGLNMLGLGGGRSEARIEFGSGGDRVSGTLLLAIGSTIYVASNNGVVGVPVRGIKSISIFAEGRRSSPN